MADLSGVKVAILVTDGFEETELTSPQRALHEAGAQVELVAPHPGEIQAFRHFKKGITVHVDNTLEKADPEEFNAVHLPGGARNADALRVMPKVQAFLKTFDQLGKPISAICHAPLLLVSAGLVHGRQLTSYHTIQDDIRKAGGLWINKEVVENVNWVTSRAPKDLPAFNRAMVALFTRQKKRTLAA